MKPHIILATVAALTISPLTAAEAEPRGAAIEFAKKNPDFAAFAEKLVQLTQSGDTDGLRKLTVVGDGESYWKATKTSLEMIKTRKFKSSSYEFDAKKRTYELMGTPWDLSLPAEGQITVSLRYVPEGDEGAGSYVVRYLVAKTEEGWKVAVPTKQQ